MERRRHGLLLHGLGARPHLTNVPTRLPGSAKAAHRASSHPLPARFLAIQPPPLQPAAMPLARAASSPVKPLLPVASPPTSPGVGRLPLHQHLRRRARRVMLLGLLAFVAVNAAWGSRALIRALQHAGGGSDPDSLAGGQTLVAQQAAPATAGAAGAKAASAADSAASAALDAGAALRDAAGAVKHTAVAAGKAAGAAASLATPVAVKAAAAVGNATTKAASALASAAGGVAAKAAGAAKDAAGSTAATATDAASKVAGSAASAAKAAGGAGAGFVWEERPGGAYPPAELPPPVVEASSNDSCAQVRACRGCLRRQL